MFQRLLRRLLLLACHLFLPAPRLVAWRTSILMGPGHKDVIATRPARRGRHTLFCARSDEQLAAGMVDDTGADCHWAPVCGEKPQRIPRSGI